MGQKVTRLDILKAMQEFDRNFRGKVERRGKSIDWGNWLKNESYVYAVIFRSKLYPIKKILAIAYGTYEYDVYAGLKGCEELLELGFETVKLTDGSEAI